MRQLQRRDARAQRVWNQTVRVGAWRKRKPQEWMRCARSTATNKCVAKGDVGTKRNKAQIQHQPKENTKLRGSRPSCRGCFARKVGGWFSFNECKPSGAARYEVRSTSVPAVCDARLSHTVSLFPLQKASRPSCYQNLLLLLVLPVAIPATAYVTMTRSKTRPIQKFAKAVSQCSAEVSDRSFTLPASPCHIPKLPLY